MRPKGVKITVTTTEALEKMGRIASVMIKNQGTNNCQIEFDADISSDSYLLESGEAIWIDYPFVNLHTKTASGNTTLYLIKVIQ